jgi:hypothetical protein
MSAPSSRTPTPNRIYAGQPRGTEARSSATKMSAHNRPTPESGRSLMRLMIAVNVLS